MNTRKIILLTAVALLAAVYTVQLIHQGKNKVRNEVLKHTADTIQVADGSEIKYTLHKEVDSWLLGDGKEADSYSAKQISDAVQTIKILGKISTGTDAQRFGFDGQQELTVTASENSKLIRTIRIGKAAGTAMQTYIRLDDSQTVLLASGDLNGIFGKTEAELTAQKDESAEENKTDVENDTGN